MAPRNRFWLAAAVLVVGGGLSAQTPGPNPLLPPLPKPVLQAVPPVGPTEGKPVPPVS